MATKRTRTGALEKYRLLGGGVKLTKKLLFSLEEHHLILTTCGNMVEEKVAPSHARDAQWQRFRKSGHAQRNCMIFDTSKPCNPTEMGGVLLFGKGVIGVSS